MPLADCHTTVLLVSRTLVNVLKADSNRGGFTMAQMVVSGTGRLSGLAISSVAACCSIPSIHSVNFPTFQPLKN